MTRTRECEGPFYGGLPCQGLGTDSMTCNLRACAGKSYSSLCQLHICLCTRVWNHFLFSHHFMWVSASLCVRSPDVLLFCGHLKVLTWESQASSIFCTTAVLHINVSEWMHSWWWLVPMGLLEAMQHNLWGWGADSGPKLHQSCSYQWRSTLWTQLWSGSARGPTRVQRCPLSRWVFLGLRRPSIWMCSMS